ncbi:hypothetical protein BU17DRAFT_67362 [Hysterangium stoloniferum]|nr:hypothetical protein BU17DRAFT_67362 [Hysterangium stoloniferum]
MLYTKITSGPVLVAILSSLIQGITASTTSLYLPGFDPQPIDASVIGVGSDGRTTWLISQGPLTDAADGGLPFPATLVEGPTFASVHQVVPGELELDVVCGIDGSQAVCTEVGSVSGSIDTETLTDTVVPFAVQVSETTPAAASPPSGTTTPVSGTPSPSPAASLPSAVSTSSPAASTATGTGQNGAKKPLIDGALFGVMGLIGAVQYIL